MTTWVCVSATREEAARLNAAGPRRDFTVLAERLGATVIYRGEGSSRGLAARLLGPHVRQAWATARAVTSRDRVFADGEHIGIPLLLFLAVQMKRPAVVQIGHLPGRWWKLRLLWLATRLGTMGTLLLHSRRQEQLVRGWLGPDWRARLIEYQVDTDFWTDDGRTPQARVVAVGSEQRDYEALLEAAEGLPASVLIAAGSLWARELATTDRRVPANVEVLTEPLPFRDLLERYRDAAVVVVPLQPSENQAGVTTLLEAMSVERPVVVTATRGQTDVVAGPLVDARGELDGAATADRGPGFGTRAGGGEWTGLYVSAGDAGALRAALQRLLADEALRLKLGAAARRSVVRDFTFEAYVSALEDSVRRAGEPSAPASTRPVTHR